MKALGGYFELALPRFGNPPHARALRLQSARAALRALLEHQRIARVFVPDFTCDSMAQSVKDAGAAVETYALDDTLLPATLPHRLPAGSALLYVNYFGLCSAQVRQVCDQHGPGRVIIDNSQALFDQPEPSALGTLYSPRKFAGLPDGGLLVSAGVDPVAPPETRDQGSIERMVPLLLRAAEGARQGYPALQVARQSLRDSAPRRMSALTERLMESIDWLQVAACRRVNYSRLAARLAPRAVRHWSLGDTAVPLCFPLMLRHEQAQALREALAREDIFVPVYWPEARTRVAPGSIEARLMDATLCLPIDQRLDESDLDRIAGRVESLLFEPRVPALSSEIEHARF